MSEKLLLPERAVLVHIGPHKTGTSAIQDALQRGSAAMAEHGVIFPGSRALHMHAARAVLGTNPVPGDPRPTQEHWQQLCDEVAAANDQRVVISRETFCAADENQARQVVDGLGGPRVHVLITLRPLVKLLPSIWQQRVRTRSNVEYEAWLDQIFNPPSEGPDHVIWTRHRHDALVQRWASVVGPDRVTVMVVDDFQGEQLLRPIEQLLGLPEQLLQLAAHGANRSLSYPEIELVRQLGAMFNKRRWPNHLYRDVVRHGTVRRLQLTRSPSLGESKIGTPKWALDRAAEMGTAASAGIAASGVRILGDITTLATVESEAEAAVDEKASPLLPVSAVSEVVFGIVVAGIRRERELARRLREKNALAVAAQQRAAREPNEPRVKDLRSVELLSIVASRIRRRLRRKLRRSN